MSNQIPTHFVRGYTTNVEMLLQQMDSRFENTVMRQTGTGDQMVVVEQFGPVVAQKRTTRHGDTPLIETPHARRWCVPQDYEWADLIASQDKLRMLLDPQSSYVRNGVSAHKRALDDEIIFAFKADAKTGKEGAGTEVFNTSLHQIAAGGTGMTVAKLREAKKRLIANHVDVDMDPLYVTITAEQHDDLLTETQAINLDYTTRPVLVDGRIRSFMGFNFVESERLLSPSASVRSCPAWAKSGMALCEWETIVIRVAERPDKSHEIQVYIRSTCGATRTHPGKVIDILCAE